MLSNLSTVDSEDYLQKTPKLRKRKVSNSKTTVGNISVPTQRHTNFDSEALDEENSAFDFDALHRSQASKTERLYREKQAVIFGNNRSSFLSRKDLLQYTKSIPTKVKATISLNERSEDYIKKFHEISKKNKSRKKDLYYWQASTRQKKAQETEDTIEFFRRVDYFARSKQHEISPRQNAKMIAKRGGRKEKRSIPTWFKPPSENVDEVSTTSKKDEDKKSSMAHKFRKRDLVTTTWVDGPEIARINATKAVSNREYMIHLLEDHLLRCRVDGILYMDGPKRQFAKYLELFGKIVKATLNVCEKIKEWRDQLHLTAKIKYEKTWKVKVGERPPFYWTYMKQNKGNAGRSRVTVNYMQKVITDVGDLLLQGMAELTGLLGHENELLIGPHRANISGNFIQGIRVCPLLLPSTLIEVANGTASPRDCDLKPLKTLEGWSTQAPARWYNLDPKRVRFAAKYILEEEDHQAQIESLRRNSMDALSTVLEDRGRNGQRKMNKKLSTLVARNVMLTRDFEMEEQVNIALTEELVKRKLRLYKEKLRKAVRLLNEAVGEKEVSERKLNVLRIRKNISDMKTQLSGLMARTIKIEVTN
eukprot:g15077.t1